MFTPRGGNESRSHKRWRVGTIHGIINTTVLSPGTVISVRIKGKSPRMAPLPVGLLFQDRDRIYDFIQRKLEFLFLIEVWKTREEPQPDFLSMNDHEDLPTNVRVPGTQVFIPEKEDFEYAPGLLLQGDSHCDLFLLSHL
tara:strand:- start:722 stop:1141 length:420 start_codon:yes stop_codon:yes gene_type:complete